MEHPLLLTAILITDRQERLRAEADADRLARQAGRGRRHHRFGRSRRRAD